MNFDDSFAILVDAQHEGGFQNRKDDPGNWTPDGRLVGTKYGISARTYPNEDIEHLTVERAKEIYLRDFWVPAACDELPDAARFHVFDMAVNSGPLAARRTLQLAVNTTPDGVVGPVTKAAAQAMDPCRLVSRFNGARLMYLATLPNWTVAGRGWARRIGSNLMGA